MDEWRDRRQHGVRIRDALRSASALPFLYALGYPIGESGCFRAWPMAVLTFRFGLAAAILGSSALLAACVAHGVALDTRPAQRLAGPGDRLRLLYLALQRGAPAVSGAVVVSMNPVLTALLAAMFLGQSLSVVRSVASCSAWQQFSPRRRR